MRCDIYYGVQFAQSLYLLLSQSGHIDRIPDSVFSRHNDIAVSYGARCQGQRSVRDFFTDMAERTKQSESFLRMDLPATQAIEPAADGQSAVGRWTTMSYYWEDTAENRLLHCRIGHYTNGFILEDGIWRLMSVLWEPVLQFRPWIAEPDEHLAAYGRDPHAWLTDIPCLARLSAEDATTKTAATIALRNGILSWFDAYNMCGDTAVDAFELSSDARKSACHILDGVGCVLATSPVLRLSEGLDHAEAFFSVSLLKNCAKERMTHTRGSLYLTLSKAASVWQADSFCWYPYATLEPWRILP